MRSGVSRDTRSPTPVDGWSLFNAFTEDYKTVNPQTAVTRGQALHGLFDSHVALAS